MVLPPGCTMCAGSGVMCRVKHGSLRSGGISLRQVQCKLDSGTKCNIHVR